MTVLNLVAVLPILGLAGIAWIGGAFGEWARAAGLSYGAVFLPFWAAPLVIGGTVVGLGPMLLGALLLAGPVAALWLGGSAGWIVLLVAHAIILGVVLLSGGATSPWAGTIAGGVALAALFAVALSAMTTPR
ncbi:MAG: hypothetical protein AAFX81_06635 [Pseudomonadota bacterium]